MEILGHNDLETLQRYLEVTLEERRSAVAVILVFEKNTRRNNSNYSRARGAVRL